MFTGSAHKETKQKNIDWYLQKNRLRKPVYPQLRLSKNSMIENFPFPIKHRKILKGI